MRAIAKKCSYLMLDAEDGSWAAPEISHKWVFKEHNQKKFCNYAKETKNINPLHKWRACHMF